MIWRVLLLAAVVLSIPGLAGAQDHDEEARTHFQSGRLHFERGAYEEAQAEFMAAYELSQRPDLLFNLFLCAERLGELDAAIDYLERYLAEASPDAETRTQLEPRLANLRERRDARVTETPPPGGEPAPAPAATSSRPWRPTASPRRA